MEAMERLYAVINLNEKLDAVKRIPHVFDSHTPALSGKGRETTVYKGPNVGRVIIFITGLRFY